MNATCQTLLLGVGLLLTACRSGGSDSRSTDSTQVAAHSEHDGHDHAGRKEGSQTTYTCPMHPQIVQDGPGSCPICGMDLVPVSKKGEQATELQLSTSQLQLANVAVRPVGSGAIGNATVLNARLAADPNRTDVVSSRVAGRIERLLVKETGQPVRKGQVLYEIYSEPLLTQQQEFLIALRQEQELGSSEPRYRQFRQGAEQKLRLYGMTPAQIDQLARTRQVLPRIPFVAPASGTVTEIVASEGQYVAEGALLYRLADFTQLWVEVELYAGETRLVKVGDQVPVEVVGYEGGRPLTARVALVNPEYRAGSQVLVMRAVMANQGGRFQPGQQARVRIRQGVRRGLTLPVDAVVRGGAGAVVFVQTKPGFFRPRRVQTGTETDQQVAITSGLDGTEQIAMSGAYLLYSELILKKGINPFTAKPDGEGVKSTPNTEANPTPVAASGAASNQASSGTSSSPNVPPAFRQQLTRVYEASLKLTEALVASDGGRTKASAGEVRKALTGVDMTLVSGPSHKDWMNQLTPMNQALNAMTATTDLVRQRTAYAQFEDALYRSVKAFSVGDKPVYRQYCPMAQGNKGAYWLSDKKPIRNPYFGDQMLTCGETKEEIN
ncbi:efflux RND transporter periplasmic adaptor subunit (plasmid) [Fibrella sp. ES10-3-2-2]